MMRSKVFFKLHSYVLEKNIACNIGTVTYDRVRAKSIATDFNGEAST